jgi:hypothetical protein
MGTVFMVRALLALHPHFSLAVLSVAICLLPATSSAAQPKQQELSAAQKAQIRKQLKREVRTNPAVVMKRSFLRKAAASEFRLPFSVRLRRSDGSGGYEPSDDQLDIAWDDSANPWPLGDGAPPAAQDVFLSGGFTLEAVFGGGDTTGYGEPGATETIVGRGVSMTSEPFVISNFSLPCLGGPQLAADPAVITSAGSRFGVMNLFSREIRGTLPLRMTFKAQRALSCGDTPFLTDPVDNTNAPPMPVRFDGKVSVSPAITPDGKLRFGKITIDDSVTPQLSTFAYVRTCTQAPPNCTPQQFPARLKFKKVTAELLLGDVLP